MNNIKQICTRLIELWDADCDIDVEINELRTVLAEPEPEPPTDQELLRLYKVATPCYHVEEYRRELDFARAVWALGQLSAAKPDTSLQPI